MGPAGSHVLLGVAASLAVVHTAIGVDHALPFVALSRVQGWSLRRTLWITGLCGLGHVASAVVLALGALALGLAVEQLAPLETFRAHLALGLLVSFGLAYALVGAVRLWKRRPHRHVHAHHDGTVHDHRHGHADEHVHLHADARKRAVSAWALFIVLVFGPCESLVPLLLAPGLAGDRSLLLAVVLVFGALTVATMLALVTLGVLGARRFDLERVVGPRLAAAGDIAAGLTIAGSGVAVGVLGL